MVTDQESQEENSAAFGYPPRGWIDSPNKANKPAAMASGDAYDVFISYARSDGDGAAELNGWLCAQGFTTFFDRSALHSGLRWVPALEEAIDRSKAVAILVGKHGIGNTQQYERELALVRQTGDAAFPVIPVLMPGCDSPPTGFLKLLTWVDLSKGAGVLQQTERLADLRAALLGEAVAASAVRASICPYRGLEPFREEDAAFFCGREEAIRDLVAHAAEHPFVAVVGPSGSGKSSLVFAGLIPALRKQGQTTIWDALVLRPGKAPLTALAEAFGVAPNGAGPAAIDTWLEGEAAAYRDGDADKLGRILDRRLDSAPEKPDRLLVYVDQWEELYAMAPPPEDKERVKQHSADVERFIELIVAAASVAGSRTSVVMTVRADFYNPVIRNPHLAALLPKQQVNIPPMSRGDLRAAIKTPAKTAGLSFAPPELVDRILDDVGLEEGRLPLLQFALKETWGKREGNKLTAEAYTAVGGVAHAIEKTAEDAYERLSPAQKDAARRLFLRLVTPGEGQADTRARSAIPDDLEQRDIVNLFSTPKTRLLVTALQGAGPRGGEVRATVEVAHEALIQRWPTLRDWVRTNRDNMRARAAILRAKAEWEEHGESEKFLLDPGVQLERGRALLQNPGDVAVDDICDFIGRSIEKDQHRLDTEREVDLADQKRIADARKRTAQVAVVGLVVALLVAAAALWQYFDAAAAKKNALAERDRAFLAESRANKASQEAQVNAKQAKSSLADELIARQVADQARAEAQKNADRANGNLREAQIKQSLFLAGEARQRSDSGDSGTAVLLALEALPDAADGISRPYVPEAELQLDSAWRDLRERLDLGPNHAVYSAAFSPDGKRIVTASQDKTARVWDAETGKPIGVPLRGHEDVVYSAAFSPNGKRIVTASWDDTARIWDAETGKPIGEPLNGHGKTVFSATFSPDGRRIVTASRDDTARIWDAETGKPIGEPLEGHDGAVWSAAFSPDGKRIVTASQDKTARVWDAKTGKRIGEPLKGHEDAVYSAAFSPDGKRIVTASQDKTVRVWDAWTGKPIGEPLKGHEEAVLRAAFSPDGTHIVTASLDKTARVWDAETGKSIGEPLRGHEDGVYSAVFSPDGKRIVTASLDKTARVWDAETRKSIGEPLRGHDGFVWSAGFSPNGTRIVTASSDKTARVWDAESGELIGEPLKGHEDEVWSAAFSPDGKRIVTASKDETARVWDAGTGKPIDEPLRGHKGIVFSAGFSPDGKRIVTASQDETARVWDARTGEPIGEPLRGHRDSVYSAAFSPDGRRIVTASQDKTARVWDAWTGKPIGEPLNGHDGPVWSAAFSPDGKRIVTASYDRTARVWDAETGKPIGEPLRGHEDAVLRAAFSSDGKRIVTASLDKTARVWDAETGKPIGEPLKGHEDGVRSAAFSPDGRRIVTASMDKTARIWEVFTTQALVDATKAAVPRCLTPSQRKAFVLLPEPPAWCIETEKWPYATPEWKEWLADKRAGKSPPLPAVL
jgi:WD40 repeat protein/energy-coupling factor transporter ATP-binding protein EcfA2